MINKNLFININSLNPLFSMGEGGIYRGSKVLLYGIAGGGKTTACLTVALNELKLGNTVFYIDADFNGLHVLRMQKLYKDMYNLDFPMDKFNNTAQHKEAIMKLWAAKGLIIHEASTMIRIDLASSKLKAMRKKPSLIIIDSISQYFRIDIIQKDFKPAQLMMKILNTYVGLAAEYNATIILTAQRVSEVKMAMNPADRKNSIVFREFVGGELLHHIVDNIVEIRIKNKQGVRVADTSIKYRNPVEITTLEFTVVDTGLVS